MAKNNDFIMLPTVDFCFKELMQNGKVRRGFISSLLKVPPETISNTALLPTIFLKEYDDSKYGILDVRVKLEDDTEIDLEMQTLFFRFWVERTLYYLGRLLSDQLKEGEPYEDLKKCIQVSILDYIQFPDIDRFYTCFHIYEDDLHIKYTDKIEIHVLELPKIGMYKEIGNDILSWARFFNAKTREEFEELAKENEYLEEAYNTLVRISADEQKRLEYEAREKALRDYNHLMTTSLKAGREDGEARGLKKGIKQGEEYFGMLTQKLLEESKTDDLLKAASDIEFRETLYCKYGIKEKAGVNKD